MKNIRKCKRCGTPFKRKTSRAIYCSDYCNDRARPVNPVHLAARNAVAKAIRHGELVRPAKCDDCGEERPGKNRDIFRGGVVAHHEDYSKPLDVIWICRSCHCKRHPKV